MNEKAARSTPPVSITPRSRIAANGRNVKPLMPALFVPGVEAKLYEGVDKVRQAPIDEQLFKAAELMAILSALSQSIEAVQIALKGLLGLHAQHNGDVKD